MLSQIRSGSNDFVARKGRSLMSLEEDYLACAHEAAKASSTAEATTVEAITDPRVGTRQY
jgi:hypothetical protein